MAHDTVQQMADDSESRTRRFRSAVFGRRNRGATNTDPPHLAAQTDFSHAEAVTDPEEIKKLLGNLSPKAAEAIRTSTGLTREPELSEVYVLAIQARAIRRNTETLLAELMHDLRDDNSQLRAQLATANVRVEMLETQIDQLTEALAANKPSVVRGMLSGLGAILAVAASVSQVTGYAARDAVASQPPATSYVETCTRITLALDEYPEDEFPDAHELRRIIKEYGPEQ